jgi:hypothetical protein
MLPNVWTHDIGVGGGVTAAVRGLYIFLMIRQQKSIQF